jgi:hypothetical protein
VDQQRLAVPNRRVLRSQRRITSTWSRVTRRRPSFCAVPGTLIQSEQPPLAIHLEILRNGVTGNQGARLSRRLDHRVWEPKLRDHSTLSEVHGMTAQASTARRRPLESCTCLRKATGSGQAPGNPAEASSLTERKRHRLQRSLPRPDEPRSRPSPSFGERGRRAHSEPGNRGQGTGAAGAPGEGGRERARGPSQPASGARTADEASATGAGLAVGG